MSTHSPHGAPGPGHERSDIRVKVAVVLTAGIVLATALAMAGMRLLFVHLAAREARNQPARTTLVPKEARPLPPEPRLQANPTLELVEHRAEERAALAGYGWVDRGAGRVRIPVERAIELVVARGLPRPVAPAAQPAVAGERGGTP